MINQENAIVYPLLSDKEMQSYLPINDPVYTVVLSSLNRETPDKTAQSHIIIGPEGSGKTIFLKRIATELSRSELFKPICLDGQRVFSGEEIWEACPGGNFDSVMEWQKLNSRRIVLLIDNIQYLFQRINNASQFSLRGKLNNAGAPIMIATSNEVLPAFTDYKAAFFDGLRLHYLRQPDNTILPQLGLSKRELRRAEALLNYLPTTMRSLMLIKRVIRLSKRTSNDLDMLCDLSAPTYQLKYSSLVMQSQRILTTLANADFGMTMTQLRKATKQEGGFLSPYLNKLVEMNILQKNATTTRNATYLIADKLFKLWLTKI